MSSHWVITLEQKIFVRHFKAYLHSFLATCASFGCTLVISDPSFVSVDLFLDFSIPYVTFFCCAEYIACSSPSHPFKNFLPTCVHYYCDSCCYRYTSVYFATCQLFSLKIGLQVFLELNIQQRHLLGHEVSCIHRSSMLLSIFSPWVANPRPTGHICKLDMYILQNCAII